MAEKFDGAIAIDESSVVISIRNDEKSDERLMVEDNSRSKGVSCTQTKQGSTQDQAKPRPEYEQCKKVLELIAFDNEDKPWKRRN